MERELSFWFKERVLWEQESGHEVFAWMIILNWGLWYLKSNGPLKTKYQLLLWIQTKEKTKDTEFLLCKAWSSMQPLSGNNTLKILASINSWLLLILREADAFKQFIQNSTIVFINKSVLSLILTLGLFQNNKWKIMNKFSSMKIRRFTIWQVESL